MSTRRGLILPTRRRFGNRSTKSGQPVGLSVSLPLLTQTSVYKERRVSVADAHLLITGDEVILRLLMAF